MSVLYKCTACEANKVLDEEVEALQCPACGGAMKFAAKSKPAMPKDLKHADVVMAKASVADVDREHKTMVVRISTDDLDRDKEVLLPGGCDLTNFRNNPIVLAMHDHSALPIGKSLWEKVREHDILAKPQFHPVANYDLPQVMFDLYADDVLKAWSVGFMPKSGGYREPTEDDLKARLDWAGCRGIYTEWELWEYSGVPVPSNPNALALAVKMGTKSIPESLLSLMELPDVGEAWRYEKPLPNEHACRLRPPGDFEDDSFRRTSREHDGKKYSVIMGKLKGESTMTEQAYRYGKDVWDVSSARAHCDSHDGILFEPAKEVRDANLFATSTVQRLVIPARLDVVASPEEIRRLTDAAIRGRVVVED